MGTKKQIQSPVRVGNQVLIRTVTVYHTGRIALLTKDEIVLVDAAWIADTGRFNNALVNSTANEVEPFPSAVSVNRGSVIDVTDWRGELPRAVK
jgi:hypothetical protein